MTATQQLARLEQEHTQTLATVEEYQARLPVLAAQIKALKPLAEKEKPAVRVVTEPGTSK